MPSKNKCNNPNRNNNSLQHKNNRHMQRSSLDSSKVDRVGYLEDKIPYMIPVKSARVNETKNPALPCMSQSFIKMSTNIFIHVLSMENKHINFEVI